MGCISSKEATPLLQAMPMQRPSVAHRRSITYAKPRDVCEDEDALRRYSVVAKTEELELGGLKLRYGYMSQRGYYPDGKFVRSFAVRSPFVVALFQKCV